MIAQQRLVSEVKEREIRRGERQYLLADYVIVHEDKRATTVDQLMMTPPPAVNNEESERLALALQKQKDRHRLYKRRFLANLSRIGLLMETVGEYVSLQYDHCVFQQDVRESERGLVYFIKLHVPWSLMIKYAEDLNFRVPIRVSSSPAQHTRHSTCHLSSRQ